MASLPAYPPAPAPFTRQQSRTPLLTQQQQAGRLSGQYGGDDDELSHTSPLLIGRRGTGSVSSSNGSYSGEGLGDPDDGAAEADEGESPDPLDATLEEIGMGWYQWRLFLLCGCSWWSDNAWLQCIAVILPRVQDQWDVSDRWIGLLSTSLFAGMMLGAWGWGSYSDAFGRVPAFNLTICVTSVFGIGSAFAPSFGWLCFALFCMGTGVGGSMPTDGTLFLENTPKTKHYLLTALSVFFSLGAIFTSILGLVILPRFSCPPGSGEGAAVACDVTLQNNGWRYMLGALGVVSIVMFLGRVLFFRLHESPKFLVASNRPTAAVIALRRISKINGDDKRWVLSDVVDTDGAAEMIAQEELDERTKEAQLADASRPGSDELSPRELRPLDERDRDRVPSPSDLDDEEEADLSVFELPPSAVSHSPPVLRKDRPAWIERLPAGWQDSADEYLARLDDLLEPRWKRTTLLVWTVWTLASAGYTIFNVFLPKFLEAKLSSGDSTAPAESTQEETLRDYVLYTVSGLPGSLLGAYLIETTWGRARTLAFSTLATSAATFVFCFVSTKVGVVASSMVVSLASTLMYAVIYGLTPEIFPTSTCGTATGIASAMSRLAGILAPLLTGALLSLHAMALPLILSAVCFFATAACAWGLRGAEERMVGAKGRGSAGGGMVH
ncbi:uncharacterized protein JCM10292_004787 [Rhodotorula paludigena]|uniref:uncharacterized protein n=1 Tax=Rhodotorula paludigena TaxID=86838 RepID=UPI00317AA468